MTNKGDLKIEEKEEVNCSGDPVEERTQIEKKEMRKRDIKIERPGQEAGG
jgi:hypothetical protein